MTYTKQGPFADRALPAMTGARLNAIDQGIADAHDAAVWTSVDLIGSPEYEVPWTPGARTMDLEIVGRVTGTQPYAIMAKPDGPGTTLNGRVVASRAYINSSDGTEQYANVFDYAYLHDAGFALADINFGTTPTDVLVKATLDVVTGLAQSHKTLKGRGATDTQIEGAILDSFLYTPAIPTGMVVQFNHNNAAAFTGLLRYLMRA